MENIYSIAKFANFVYICVSTQMWEACPSVIQIHTKYANLPFSYFTSKRCNFTSFGIFFLAVAKHFVHFAWIEI